MRLGLKQLVGVAVLVIVVVVVVIVFVFAGDDDEPKAPSRSTTTTTTSTTAQAGDDVVVTIVCLTPREAVENLVDSWLAGSRAAAGRCASGELVTLLFETDVPRGGWDFQGCEEPPTPVTCSFRYEAGVAELTVLGEEALGFIVDDLDLVAS